VYTILCCSTASGQPAPDANNARDSRDCASRLIPTYNTTSSCSGFGKERGAKRKDNCDLKRPNTFIHPRIHTECTRPQLHSVARYTYRVARHTSLTHIRPVVICCSRLTAHEWSNQTTVPVCQYYKTTSLSVHET